MTQGAAFLAGVGFAAVPGVGPFLAVGAVFSGQLKLQRADAWWWLAALLLGGPYLLTGHVVEGLLSITQVLATWLLFRSAVLLRGNLRRTDVPQYLSAGLLVGLAVTLALGLTRATELQLGTARTLFDAVVWHSNPTIFGHTILVLAALLALVVQSTTVRVTALSLGAVGVLVSGAQEAIWVWLLVAFALGILDKRSPKTARILGWVVTGIMAVIVSGLGTGLGLGRTGFLTDLTAASDMPNQFRGTEVAAGDWWYPLGVTFTAAEADVAGVNRQVFRVTKSSTDSWSRLQQIVTLQPGETYTLSTLLGSADVVRPGLDGWGHLEETGQANLGLTVAAGELSVNTVGPLELVGSNLVSVGEQWNRAHATFTYTGERPLTWYVGVVPDRASGTGVTTSFAELQLTRSEDLLPYRPGPATKGVLDIRTTRFPIWRDALSAIAARPLLGWGPDGFPKAVATLHPDEVQLRPVAAHAHNSLLAAMVDRGLLGGLGILGLFALLALRAIQQRDRPVAAVLAGVLILNFFDATLLSGAILYPLAAVLGWRAQSASAVAEAETGVGSAAAVRLGLAFADGAAGLTALMLGTYFTEGIGATLLKLTDPALLYAALVWPLAALASGLYPGYGLPSHMQLGRSVRAAVTAGILVGFLALLLPDTFGLSATALIVAVPVSAVLSPLFRTVTIRALRGLRLWGRPVALLGTGPAALGVVRHLLKNPEIGLHPVAVFGPEDNWQLPALPVSGRLGGALTNLRDTSVRHVIVSPEAAEFIEYDDVLLQGKTNLKYIQYLPDLKSLPANSVTATPLGVTLGLEVKNQLASTTNRAVKRTMDFIGGVVLGLALFPLLLIIALLIVIDSRSLPLYLSERVGRGQKPFKCVKFRSMVMNADEELVHILATNPELKAEYEEFHKLENDPRVTRVGRVLRRLSLDELPQLANVIWGQMSLVGPRPYLQEELSLMGPERHLIFLARPGMTGYWQTEARNEVSFEERQGMEAHYVRNWSVWWDIDILLRTAGVMLRKTGK